MFPSLETNGCEDLFNPHPRTMLPTFTTHLESPSSQPFPFSPDESCLINQFLLQQQDAKASLVCKNKDKCVDGTNSSEEVPRRRMGKKKDRHSKICTAQGPRDRRMRLSLTIARKFFDLQDMLGFDKASKTIEWLISKSKTSIKQVKESVAAASGSGGEGDSTRLLVDEKVKSETSKVPKRRTQTMESSCMKRESREKARERARERTATKMKMRLSSGLIDTSKTISDPNQETSEIKLTTNGAQLVEGESQEWRDANVNIIEKFLGLTSDSSSSSVFRDSEEPNTIGMVTPREHNTTSVNEENPISFSLYDYLCY